MSHETDRIKLKEAKKAEKKANRKNVSFVLAIIQAVLISIVICLVVGFIVGKNYAERQNQAVVTKAQTLAMSLK